LSARRQIRHRFYVKPRLSRAGISEPALRGWTRLTRQNEPQFELACVLQIGRHPKSAGTSAPPNSHSVTSQPKIGRITPEHANAAREPWARISHAWIARARCARIARSRDRKTQKKSATTACCYIQAVRTALRFLCAEARPTSARNLSLNFRAAPKPIQCSKRSKRQSGARRCTTTAERLTKPLLRGE
jgi:hypothetical protein